MSGGGTAFGGELEDGGRRNAHSGGGGIRVRLWAVRPDDGRGLYKVWVRGRGGSLLLGTLIPERGRLALSRTLSRSTLEQAGCWPVTGGNSVLVFSFTDHTEKGEEWRPEPDPARLCRDPLLRTLLRGRTGFFSGEEGEEHLLAAPFSLQKSSRCRCCSVWLRWRSGRGGAGWCGALTGRGSGDPGA